MAGQGQDPGGRAAEFPVGPESGWSHARVRRLLSPIGALIVGGLLSASIASPVILTWLAVYFAAWLLHLVLSETYVRRLLETGRLRRAFLVSGLTEALISASIASLGVWAWIPGNDEGNYLALSVLFLLYMRRVTMSDQPVAITVMGAIPYAVMLIAAPWIGNSKEAAEITIVAAISIAYLASHTASARRSHAAGAALAHEKTLAEERLRAAQGALAQLKSNADSAQALHRSLLTGFDDDARGPLSTILRRSETLASDEAAGAGDQRLQRCAAEIHGSCLQLISFAQDIADLGRIESGTLHVTLTRLDLTEVLAAVARDCAALLRDAQLSLEMIVDPDLPNLLADERLVRRMVVNLVTNAARETLPDGRIAIAALRLPDGGLGLRVSSSGAGLSEAELEHALETLLSGKQDEAGTSARGLSLMIVRSLAAQQSGTLSIRSRLGAGAQAMIHFPPERLASRTSVARLIDAA